MSASQDVSLLPSKAALHILPERQAFLSVAKPSPPAGDGVLLRKVLEIRYMLLTGNCVYSLACMCLLPSVHLGPGELFL